MAHDDSREREACEERIAEIKEKLQKIAGGEMRSWESDAMPAEERERFWRGVLEFEEREGRRRS